MASLESPITAFMHRLEDIGGSLLFDDDALVLHTPLPLNCYGSALWDDFCAYEQTLAHMLRNWRSVKKPPRREMH